MFCCKVTCADEQGHVWLGGSGYGDILYFSEDYGYTFSPIPIAMEERHWSTISAFDMQYLNHGIAGIEWYSPDGNHTSIGQLLLTEDNWQTVQSIPTPVNTIVSKARFWRDLWVIQQKDEVFIPLLRRLNGSVFPSMWWTFSPIKKGEI